MKRVLVFVVALMLIGNSFVFAAGPKEIRIGFTVNDFNDLWVTFMMDAVKKSTYIPAKQMGIDNRKGWSGVGMDADLVVFDPVTIRDNADYIGMGQPDAPPTGIKCVLVNGVTVLKEGEIFSDRLPGRILRQPNRTWTL